MDLYTSACKIYRSPLDESELSENKTFLSFKRLTLVNLHDDLQHYYSESR
jgi:hypothetical protein